MNNKSIYFHIYEVDNYIIIDDRLEVNWKEILLYPLPFILLLFTGISYWYVILPLVLLVSVSYFVFRIFAWLFYTTVTINKRTRKVEKVYWFLNSERRREQIDTHFSYSKIEFDKKTRSGETKFILQYKTHKIVELLVVKSEEDKIVLETALSKI